jgi:hypothetical protein
LNEKQNSEWEGACETRGGEIVRATDWRDAPVLVPEG